ncbi:hypothetical protein RZS08_65685, partial [Arthrospira platensis SPKY1]|nr:hypothetical protein [Arthrospira platensis SPKY1]
SDLNEERAPVHPWPIPDRFEYAVIHNPTEPAPYLAYTIGADFSGQGDTVERAEEMLRECIAVHYAEACRARGIRGRRVRARIHPAQAILHA